MPEATKRAKRSVNRRVRLGAGFAGLLIMVSACSIVGGSGQISTETRQVSGFSRVELVDAGDVSITQGTTESLIIEADEDVLPKLTSEVVNGTLRLGRKRGLGRVLDHPIRYQVTLTNLTGIDLVGAGRIIGSDLEIDTLDVEITGAGAVELSGSVDRQDVRLSGAGRYQAGDLASQFATAELSGTGEMVLAVDRQLTVTISGAGTVSYAGDARVEKSISGVGRLVKR